MKSKEEIKKAVETSREIVGELYANDSRLLKEENQRPDSGVAVETNIVFQEVLKYLLNE